MAKVDSVKPLVLYHAECWDGFCAAWIVDRTLFGVEAIPVYYGNPIPQVAGRDVYILDFSYPRDVLLKAHAEAKYLLVLDHHKTAKEELRGLDFCIFADDKSGGRLTWEYFHGQKKSPWLVDYTEDRDLWRHQLEDSQVINAAIRSYPLNFELWDDLAKHHPTDFTQEGESIRRREKQIVAEHLLRAKEVEMDGHRILVANATVLYSEIAGELAKGRPFGAVYFDRADGVRQWSLRSSTDGVDVSVIAEAHGGGGHKDAAGYEEGIGGVK